MDVSSGMSSLYSVQVPEQRLGNEPLHSADHDIVFLLCVLLIIFLTIMTFYLKEKQAEHHVLPANSLVEGLGFEPRSADYLSLRFIRALLCH